MSSRSSSEESEGSSPRRKLRKKTEGKGPRKTTVYKLSVISSIYSCAIGCVDEEDSIMVVPFEDQAFDVLVAAKKIFMEGSVVTTSKKLLSKTLRQELLGKYTHIPNAIGKSNLIPDVCIYSMSNIVTILGVCLLKYDPKKEENKEVIKKSLLEHLESLGVEWSNNLFSLLEKGDFNRRLTQGARFLLNPFQDRINEVLKGLDSNSAAMLDIVGIQEAASFDVFEEYTNRAIQIAESNPPSTDDMIRRLEVLINSVENLTADLNEKLRVCNSEIDCKKHRAHYRMERRKQINDFFIELNVTKIFGEGGAIRSVSSLPSLLNYIISLTNNPNYGYDEKLTLERLRDRLFTIKDESDTEQLAVILLDAVNELNKLLSYITEANRPTIQNLIACLKNSTTFQEAWNYALRLKGTLYEIMFAESNSLRYTTEGMKFSVADILFIHARSKYSDFNVASSNNPAIRDLKPDFYMVVPRNSMELVPGWAVQLDYKSPTYPEGSEPESGHQFSGESSSDVDPDTRFALTFDETSNLLQMSNYDRYGSYSGTSYDSSKFFELVKNIIDTKDTFRTMTYNCDRVKTEFDGKTEKEQYMNDLRYWLDRRSTLVVIEVGYQTDAENKVLSDARKWQIFQRICKALGLSTMVITISDSTNTIKSSPWIREAQRLKLGVVMPTIFARLTASSPPGVSDIVISDVSTQKFRSAIKSGHLVKTPISQEDVEEYFEKSRKRLFKRPSGLILGDEVQELFKKSLVEGSTIVKDEARVAVSFLKDNVHELVELSRSQPLRFELILRDSGIKFMLGCMSEFIDYCSKNAKICKCFEEVTKKKALNNSQEVRQECLNIMCNLLDKSNHQNHNCKFFETEEMKGSWFNRISEKLSNTVVKIESSKERPFRGTLDILLSNPISGRTGKAKELKNRVMEMLGEITYLSKGILRDSKGLILCSTRNLYMKVKENSDEVPEYEQLLKRKKIEKEREIKEAKMSKKNRISRKEHKVATLKRKIDYVMEKRSMLTKELQRCIELCSEDLTKWLESSSMDFEDYYPLKNCKSYLKNDNLFYALSLLLRNDTVEDSLSSILTAKAQKFKKFEDNIDNRFRPFSAESLNYFLEQGDRLSSVHIKQEDIDIYYDFLKEEIKDRYHGTLYAGLFEYIKKITILMNDIVGIRNLYIYSRLCETFCLFTSEMTMSGVKMMKIKGTDLNLMVKVNRNKNTNCCCIVLDSNFNPLGNMFMMDRAKAVLGQGAYYCFIINCLQTLQTQRCIDFLDEDLFTCRTLLKNQIDIERESTIELIKKLSGVITNLTENPESEDLISKMLSTSSYRSRHNGSLILAKLACCYNFILNPIIMRNSRKISKLTQMLRYPMMLSLSEYGFPYGVGTKLKLNLRNIEDFVAQRYFMFVGSRNISSRKEILEGFKLDKTYNMERVLSIQLILGSCRNERQFLSDIYICHIYNKEMISFSEGSIRVLEEMGSKHIEWEDHLEKAIENRSLRDVRLLMGLKHLPINVHKPQIAVCKGKSKASGSSSSPNDDNAKEDSSASGSGKSDKTGSDSKKKQGSSSSKTAKSSKKSVRFQDSMDKSEPWSLAKSSSVINVAKKASRVKTHTLSRSKLLKDIARVSEIMPDYSFCVPELIQIAAVYCQNVYSSLNISKALKSKRNSEPISKISETTSIISEPKLHHDLEAAVNILRSCDAVKLTKMVSSLRRLKFSAPTKCKEFEKLLINLVSKESTMINESVAEFKAAIEKFKLQKIQWRDVFLLQFEDVIRTDDPSNLFSFLKSFWKSIRGLINKNYRSLCTSLMVSLGTMKGFTSEDEMNLKHCIEKAGEEIIKLCIETTNNFYKNKLRGDSDATKEPNEDSVKDLYRNRYFMLYNMIEELNCEINEIEIKKEENPDVAFPKEESLFRDKEFNFLNEFREELLHLCLFRMMIQCICPMSISDYEGSRIIILTHRQILSNTKEELEKNNSIEGTTIYNKMDILVNATSLFNNLLSELSGVVTPNYSDKISNYCELLTQNVQRPLSLRLNKISKDISNVSQLAQAIANMIVHLKPMQTRLDYGILIAELIKGSIVTARKLLDRHNRGLSLPRSIRSKVIYEMLRASKESGSSNVQEMAFGFVANPTHRFYGALAPKAQIGGDRDLLVNESKTKIVIHTTEAFSKSLLESCVRNDGLTNKKLKQEILNYAMEMMQQSEMLDNKLDSTDKGESKLGFLEVRCINGDCAKWGPIHCCSIFSLMMMQLLNEVPDWMNFYKLVMLKSLDKMIEIPVASQTKIINSFISNDEVKKSLSLLKSRGDLKEKNKLLKEFVNKHWQNSKLAKVFTEWYLAEGKAYFTPYNHMGQGIHHATSSLLGNVCSFMIDDLMVDYLETMLPGTNAKIQHAGSSDDFLKIVVVTGCLGRKRHDENKLKFDKVFIDCLNLMTLLMRSCQMKVSEKTVVSSIVAEFYSEFAFFNRVSPSTQKFTSSQIISSSVTSPLILYQSVHVNCQQAMYMGVPLLTIVALAIFKQMVFINNSSEFYMKYGKLICNSLPICGRLYLPQYRYLTSSTSGLEDLEIYKSALDYIKQLMIGEVDDRSSVERRRRSLTSDDHFESQSSTEEESSDELLFKKNKRTKQKKKNKGSLIESGSSGGGSVPVTEGKHPLEESGAESDDSIQLSEFEEPQTNNLNQATLICVMFRYYRLSSEPIFKNEFSKLSRFDYETILSDPFIQLMPESVRSQMEKLRAFKRDEISEKNRDDRSKLSFVAELVISQGAMTENYQYELARLEQALNSKNVVWGLSGGIREVSLPIHKQMLRAFLFENRISELDLDHWISDRESAYISDKNKLVPENKRIRFSDFLDFISSSDIYYKCDTPSFETLEPDDASFLFSDSSHPVKVCTKEHLDETYFDLREDHGPKSLISSDLETKNLNDNVDESFAITRFIQTSIHGSVEKEVKSCSLTESEVSPRDSSILPEIEEERDIISQSKHLVSSFFQSIYDTTRTRLQEGVSALKKETLVAEVSITEEESKIIGDRTGARPKRGVIPIIEEEDKIFTPISDKIAGGKKQKSNEEKMKISPSKRKQSKSEVEEGEQKKRKAQVQSNISSNKSKSQAEPEKDNSSDSKKAENEKYIPKWKKEVQRLFISVDTNKLESIATQVESLIKEITDRNYVIFRDLERESIKENSEARKVLVSKSEIWVSEKLKVLKNNPSVVIAYSLDPSSIYNTRPTDVRYPYLGQDLQSLTSNFPSISSSVSKIKRALIEGEENSEIECEKFAAMLTNISRMLSTGRGHKIDLYFFRDSKDLRYENNPRNLVMYTMIEGRKIETHKIGHLQFYNENLYTLEGCMSIISWLQAEDDLKTSLLIRFLRSNISSYFNEVEDCWFDENVSLEKTLNSRCQVATLLQQECSKLRDNKKSENLRAIINSVMHSDEIKGTVLFTVPRPSLIFRGDINNGSIEFSSSDGSALGIFMNNQLFLTLSKDNLSLLYGLENLLLKRLGFVDLDNLHNTHLQFLKLLPTYGKDTTINTKNSFIFLKLDNRSNFNFIIRDAGQKRDGLKYLFISNSDLVVRYMKPNTQTERVCIKWGRNKITVGVEIDVYENKIPKSIERMQEIINQRLSKTDQRKIEKLINNRSRYEEIASINLPSNVPISSQAIIHKLIKHPVLGLTMAFDLPLGKEFGGKIYEQLNIQTEEMKNFYNEISAKNTEEVIQKLEKVVLPDIEKEVRELELQYESNKDKTFEKKLKSKLKIAKTNKKNTKTRLLFLKNKKEEMEKSVEDRLDRLLRSFDQIEDIYPINIILDSLGIQGIELEFTGIKGKAISSSGNWKININQETALKGIRGIMRSITRLGDNVIDYHSSVITPECNSSKEYYISCEYIKQKLRRINMNPSDIDFLIYITNLYVCTCIRDKGLELSEMSWTINRSIMKSRPGFRTSESQEVRLSIDNSDDGLMLFIDMKFHVSRKPSSTLVFQGLNSKLPTLTSLIGKRVTKVRTGPVDIIDANNCRVLVYVDIYKLSKQDDFYNLIIDIANLMRPDKGLNEKDIGEFLGILCLSMFGNKIKMEKLPKKLVDILDRYWPDESKLSPKEDEDESDDDFESKLNEEFEKAMMAEEDTEEADENSGVPEYLDSDEYDDMIA